MAIPMITKKINFQGKPRPPLGTYTIKLTTACELLQLPITQAIYKAYTVGDFCQVSIQPAGGTLKLLYCEVLTQARMDYAINSTPPMLSMEICTLKNLSKTPLYILKVDITDSNSLFKKTMAPNTPLRLI